MARIKDAAQVAEKWSTRAGAALPDYKLGVAGAGQDWQANAIAGEGNYQSEVVKAASEGRYGRGIQNSGGQYYQDRALRVGAERFPGGVAASKSNMAEGIAPVLEVARTTNAGLEPRRPRGQNMGRANAHAEAQHKARLMRLGKI